MYFYATDQSRNRMFQDMWKLFTIVADQKPIFNEIVVKIFRNSIPIKIIIGDYRNLP